MPRPGPAKAAAPRVIILMGVSGSGKSTIGKRLGTMLGWPFRDADSFHPEANVAKMSQGIPLTDEDRAPWLAAIAAWIDARIAAREHGVVSCSALKRAYRRVLLDERRGVGLVYLKGDFALISDRMSRRQGHFMPVTLLESQFRTLEEPVAEERALIVPIWLSPRKVTESIVRSYGLEPARRIPPA